MEWELIVLAPQGAEGRWPQIVVSADLRDLSHRAVANSWRVLAPHGAWFERPPQMVQVQTRTRPRSRAGVTAAALQPLPSGNIVRTLAETSGFALGPVRTVPEQMEEGTTLYPLLEGTSATFPHEEVG